MHLDDLAAPRACVEQVDVLRDDRLDETAPLELREGVVRVVRLGPGQHLDPQRVEAPDLLRIGVEARSDAYSIGSTCAQMPVGERKSGIPLSVETPAPVRTTHGWRVRISSARRSADMSCDATAR